jgi:hypothetical protein
MYAGSIDEAKQFGYSLLSSAIGAKIPAEDEDMEIEEQEVKFRLILGGAALIGIGLVVATTFLPDTCLIWRALGLSVGEALIVAAILGITVDRYAKDFLVRKASTDLFKYLVGYKLPEALQNRLRDLMGTSLIRERYQATFKLIPQPQGEVLIDVRYQFDLKNISLTNKAYTPKVQLEKHDHPKIFELRCDEKDRNFQKLADSDGTIGAEMSDVPGVIEAVGENIDLVPGKVYLISGHYQLRTPSNHSDTLSFLNPTVDVTVRVECPDEFQFVIEGAEVTAPNMWQFGGHAFLPSEHVRIRWFRIRE